MKTIVIGLGVQGRKRRQFAGADFAGSVDSHVGDADYRSVCDVPLVDYDAALVCTPDEAKYEILEYLLSHKKHALVEKPLWGEPGQLEKLESLARSCGVVCYTAYNHRFEPHFKRMKEVLASGVLGRIYSCRMFYGNGTARLVRESPWRDKGLGIIKDLGSHLVDTCRFWFPGTTFDFRLNYSNNFENLSPDHAILTHAGDKFHVELEMTMLMWKNHFTCDILAEKGSAHISSLCKWGPTKFSLRHRLLPSGKPREESVVLEQPDPTWAEEYKCFVDLCRSGAKTRLDHDRWIQETLSQFDKDK